MTMSDKLPAPPRRGAADSGRLDHLAEDVGYLLAIHWIDRRRSQDREAAEAFGRDVTAGGPAEADQSERRLGAT